MTQPRFSIIICTYNRATLLANVLQSLCTQQLDRAQYEVIVVDNNSTDDTAAVCQLFATRHPQVYYLVEPQQGLSYARNRGWQAARGDYVAYLDDDCQAPPTWLAVAQEVIVQVAPDVLGGPYFAFYNTPKPAWFKDDYGSWTLWVKNDYGMWSCIEEQAQVGPDILHGGNLFLRRDLLAKSGGFDPALGMNGKQMAYGEETALLLRLHAICPTTSFYYEPRLLVYHLVRPEKLSIWWQLRSKIMHGQADLHVYQAGRQPFPWWAFWLLPPYIAAILLRALLRAWCWRDRTHYPYWQNYLYESTEVSKYLHRLGMWSAYVQATLPFGRSRTAGNRQPSRTWVE